MKPFAIRILLAVAASSILLVPDIVIAGELRLLGPATLEPGVENLIWVEHREANRNWKKVDPAEMKVRVTGDASLVEDPAAILMNPISVRSTGTVDATVEVAFNKMKTSKTWRIANQQPCGKFEATMELDQKPHVFQGFGGGVVFYDNQRELSEGDDIWNKCFVDMPTRFLHLLIRPDYEPQNDNADWQNVDWQKFDFAASRNALEIAKKALDKNPDLEIYVSLYAPPAWMKSNNSTTGDGSLKAGREFRQELAEYIAAYMHHAKTK